MRRMNKMSQDEVFDVLSKISPSFLGICIQKASKKGISQDDAETLAQTVLCKILALFKEKPNKALMQLTEKQLLAFLTTIYNRTLLNHV
jgi:hypothetical protein